MSQKTLAFVGCLVGGLVLDQVTKFLVYTRLEYRIDEIEVIPGLLSIVHAQNTGAAMGFMDGFPYRMWIFGAFTIIAVAIVLNLFRALPKDDRFVSAMLGLILSGALGNFIDRVHKQSVTDFIRVFTENEGVVGWIRSVPYGQRFCGMRTCEWPSFNIADSALVIGVCLFLGYYAFVEESEEEGAEPEAEPTD